MGALRFFIRLNDAVGGLNSREGVYCLCWTFPSLNPLHGKWVEWDNHSPCQQEAGSMTPIELKGLFYSARNLHCKEP